MVQTSEASQSHNCDGCCEVSGYGYYCSSCEFGEHLKCIDWPEIINHPCHSRNLLKIVSIRTIDYTGKVCHLCNNPLGYPMYHCSI
ncbi:hypothetical protein AtNW77_Chr5g0100401 [Arabidopsis thaliana]|uniref:Cysteine/Histidine-rich C1 domain family protein n=3 Tax=Arabidopsis TaxID=3701 RepID=Q9FFE2_ARATH|nr:Cysteine/Histidine-rich C1 domain family protein [Arabidopsis thaliana]AED92291.1 Cysteine/Histidine-rich C1 domain family protein [Arabidopsis thaliana]KAG7602463.1 hypothetical protein ISN45_At05g015270 [Arabidopsis thaliana x Arabidopsis arenosa]KAG7609401.1 hypothetical protein ISN44_As05g015200 [Arabidopsis suecica]BAB09610.1 unnamed protein product [Arabidopsis thaliana]|eukprot:NP_197147.1 Cysteine/Histidine-rich C1 domain family protein [Arabidopsis thaliana]